MEISNIENLGIANTARQNASGAGALERAAEQFEAILLMQLTSTLNNIGSSEDSLFGQDGGSDLAQKMFSEQLATAMAEAGGVGLKDVILQQLGFDKNKISAENSKNRTSLSKAISAVQDITENKFSNQMVNNNKNISQMIDRTGKTNPVVENFAPLRPGEAQIISTDSTVENDEDWRRAFTNEKKTERLYVPQSVIKEILSPGKNPAGSINNTNFEMPIEGRLSSEFGNRFHPIDRKMKFHPGLDIAAPRGTPIKATADGIVLFSGKRGGYGNMVILDHGNGRTSRYAHADTLLVEKDQKVSAGQPIATVGSTGKSTGPHLHFEIRENKKAVDPLKVISNVLPENADR